MKSTLFSKAVRYIEMQGYNVWFILSAKHGFLTRDKVIETYDVTLNKMKSAEKKAWSNKVAEQIISLGLGSVDFYAGANYRTYLIPLLEAREIKCKVPLLGKSIGKQLQFYSHNT